VWVQAFREIKRKVSEFYPQAGTNNKLPNSGDRTKTFNTANILRLPLDTF